MEICNYINLLKKIYTDLHSFIESTEEEEEEFFKNFVNDLESNDSNKCRDEYLMILRIINKISKYHHRSSNFFVKTEKIISQIEGAIKQEFSNFELFKIFKNNKHMLLLLLQKNIIKFDDQIINFFQTYGKYSLKSYFQYFEPEINVNQIASIEDFEEKRQIGENDSQICTLIRQDSIIEFVKYVNINNIYLSSRIKQSIFETNPFLYDKTPTLIEYATFFGSIQIIKYLINNNVELTPSLWIYAIHSQNPELIHLLEENYIEPDDVSYEECMKESVKCHHIDFTAYIQENLLDKNIEENNLSFEKLQLEIKKKYISFWDKVNMSCNYEKNILSYGFHYYNFDFIPNDFNNQFIFYYLVQYDYFTLVKLLVETKEIDANIRIVLLYIIFNIILNKFLWKCYKFSFDDIKMTI